MNKILKTVFIAAFWLLVWEILALIIDNRLLFPSPTSVVCKLGQMVITSDFWISTLTSLFRVLLGIILATILGVIIAIASSKFKLIYDVFYPFMTVIKATPVASFIILIVLFIGKGVVPTIIAILMVTPVIWGNVYEGISNVDKDLKEVCKVYKIPFKKQLKALYIPSILPYFTSAVLSSVGLGWKAGIAAEILYPPLKSIGRSILDSKQYFETTELFAWTVTVIILSLLIELIVKLLIKKIPHKKIKDQ
ncbi:MAG: ABC transporter permease subunit [Clostridia bacterium]|nr:ABC transporter permease subunit [Clostridia bacterium]MBQ7788171.1 ABC transporter permease subunit [Clostridia bacterium]